MTDSRIPHRNGSVSSTGRPVSLLVTNRSAISTCAWPTRIASMPGTRRATSEDAFSTYGRASPYDEEVVAPECAATMTTSAPAARIFGTQRFASDTRPGNSIRPSTLVLSQIAMPGLVSPRMPTVTRLGPPTSTLRSTYGGNAGRPLAESIALAPSSGKSSCSSNLRSSGMP